MGNKPRARLLSFQNAMRANDCLQLRRAISIQAERKRYLRSTLSRRQLQGFVGLRLSGNTQRGF
jgi:hypothetical protein